MCFSCPPTAIPTACFCSSCYPETLPDPLIERILSLPNELFFNVLAFDRKTFLVFQLVAKKTNEKVVALLQSFKVGIVTGAKKGGSPLYERISTLLPDQNTHVFHEVAYRVASMYGRKWGVECPIFASIEEISQVSEKIQNRRNVSMMEVWGNGLHSTLALTQNDRPGLPELHDSPEVIFRWMEQNQKSCFGITPSLLPIVGRKLEWLEHQLIDCIDHPHAIISQMVPVFGENNLRSRLAEDLDRILMSQNIDVDTTTMPIVNSILDRLSQTLQLEDRNHRHISITIYCTRTSADNLQYKVDFQRDETTESIDAFNDPPATLHFYVCQALSEAQYFDESELRIRVTENLEHQFASGFTEEERSNNLPYMVCFVLSDLRKYRFACAVTENAPYYFGIDLRLTRHANGDPRLVTTKSPSVMRGLAWKFPITMRLHYIDRRH